jgi:hypothetical protein
MKISIGTGIPTPIDYVDALSEIPDNLKHTIYQKILAELAKKLSSNKATLFLSLMNPEKIRIIGYR